MTPPDSQTQPGGDDLEAIPGFRRLAPDDPLLETPVPDLDRSATPAQPTTSTPNHPYLSEPTRPTPPSSSTSSTTSSDRLGSSQTGDDPQTSHDIAPEVDEALAGLGYGAFHVAGVLVNKAAQKRSHSNTRLWLATEDEATAFGEALGRIAGRRVPEELAGEDSDGADLIVMGATALGYVVRNGMGVDIEEAERIANGEPPTAQQPPAPAPPPQPAPAERRVMVQPAQQGPPPAVHFDRPEEPAPEPPSVIDPGI